MTATPPKTIKSIQYPTLTNCRMDANNWDVMDTIREIIVLESSIALGLSPDSQGRLTQFLAGINDLHLIQPFSVRFLEVCFNEQTDRSLEEDDYPLPEIMEFVNEYDSFCPDMLCDRRSIPGLNNFDEETIITFCKSIAYRGLAKWDEKFQMLCKDAIAPDPDGYICPWVNL